MSQDITIVTQPGILETVFQIASMVGIIVLFWYTVETFKIRKASEQQNKTLIRPHLAYTQDHTNFTIKNTTQNTALNVVLLTKLNGNVQVLKDSAHLSAIEPQQATTIQRNKMENATISELKKRMPEFTKLFVHITNQETQCLVVLYEDLNGSKLYTLHLGSGGRFGIAGETGYVRDLKL